MAAQDSSHFDGKRIPELVACGDSPEIPRTSFVDSSLTSENKYRLNVDSSIEISLENGINETESKNVKRKPVVRFSSFEQEVSPDVSFELVPPRRAGTVVSVNVGGLDGEVMLDEVNFGTDCCFSGGEIVGDGDGVDLYRTARVGDFAYEFEFMELGYYEVDLHFAEIEFVDGPSGVRLFDVFIQDVKVVSSLDVYGRVGANKPLVLSSFKAFVDSSKRLSIRFEQVNWSPICCGICVRKAVFADIGEVDLVEALGKPQEEECGLPDDVDHQTLRSMFESQQEELAKSRRALEEVKKDNHLKSKECQDAVKSLQELQNELMRKSMHVGSLAFAIEGQVKEKSKWFSSLRDVTRKLKIMKMDQLELIEEAAALKKCLADMDHMSSAISRTITEQVDSYQELKSKFVEGARERKELYNKVLELKGNIRVFCRCRPLNAEEVAEGATVAIDFDSAKDGELIVKSNGFPKKIFKFDAIFGPRADQVDVFEDTAPFASSVLDGYNICIFAYGQTGTGKTFTMEGTADARGVNFRTLEELFRIVKERKELCQYDISVSVLEVYNEQIRDLLASGTQAGVPAKRLEIRQVGEGIRHVPGLVEAPVNNINEAWEVLQTGSNARSVGSTNANEHSSRSHCIHCVMVKGENLMSGECTKSKLWLVDLAGSERVAKTEVQGDRLKETQSINKSLSALGDVISSLATKSPHIPFRNSKLTHLLQDSLGGDSKTLMFVQISPNESDLNETLCSLNFASRVRGVELGPPKKQLDVSELIKYKQLADKVKQEIKSKDLQVRKMEESMHYLELKMKEKDGKNKNLLDKVKELESQLLIERKLARQHVDTKIAEKYHQQQIKEQDQNTAPVREPLINRPLESCRSSNELVGGTLEKHQTNITRLPTEYKYKPYFPLPSMDSLDLTADPVEKENNPITFEQPMLPKRTGRASLCPTVRQIPMSSALRRNSLIPLPSLSSLAHCSPCQPNKNDDRDGCDDSGLSEQIIPEKKHCDSPKATRSANKRINSILRRSIQKKVQLKSPRQQLLRKGTTVVEKVSRGRTAHSRIVGTNQEKLIPQQQKERRWNAGTAVRTII